MIHITKKSKIIEDKLCMMLWRLGVSIMPGSPCSLDMMETEIWTRGGYLTVSVSPNFADKIGGWIFCQFKDTDLAKRTVGPELGQALGSSGKWNHFYDPSFDVESVLMAFMGELQPLTVPSNGKRMKTVDRLMGEFKSTPLAPRVRSLLEEAYDSGFIEAKCCH